MSNPEIPEDNYRPFQCVIPDEATGFDANGDYHCVPSVSGQDVGEVGKRNVMTHRLIHTILEDIDYPFGSTARDDEFFARLADIESHNGLAEEFEVIYNIFRKNYNGEEE